MKTEFPLLSKTVYTDPSILERDVKLFEFQEASDAYWLDANDVWDFKKDFGPFIPAYESMWLEATAHYTFEGEVVRSPRTAFKIDCIDASHPGVVAKYGHVPAGSRWLYQVLVFIEESNQWGYQIVPGMGFLWVDAEGRHISTAYIPDVKVEEAERTSVNELIWVHAKAAFYAISLMNCKNVGIEIKSTKPRGGKKTKRVGPSKEYRVIHLPKPKSSSKVPSLATGGTKLHTARGHFKTYTAEAPLMGKAVGTYYWGWQVRGRKENGEIISSYKVGT